MPETVSLDWVYDHIVCEFDHWDICLVGLVERDDEKLLCRVVNQYADDVKYTLHPIKWDETCQEYLEDYQVAYKHWCYIDGVRQSSYTGKSIEWFHDKWGNTDPIEENACE